MPKYINADALTKRIDDELCKPCRDEKQDYNGVRCRACWVDDMLIWIDSEPEVTADMRGGEWSIDSLMTQHHENYEKAGCEAVKRTDYDPFK